MVEIGIYSRLVMDLTDGYMCMVKLLNMRMGSISFNGSGKNDGNQISFSMKSLNGEAEWGVLVLKGRGENDGNQIPFGMVVMPDDQDLMLRKSMRDMNSVAGKKKFAHRLALVLSSPSSKRCRLLEWDKAIWSRTQVVSSIAFIRSSTPSPVSMPACFTPRAHQPSARITTKKPLAVPFSIADQSAFDGT